MPANRITLLDIAKANGSDATVGLIDETVKAHPELTFGAAKTIKGTSYKTLVRTSTFSGSTFRSANEGATVGKATYENRLVETFIINPRWEADKAVADGSEEGANAYIAMEAEPMMEKSLVDLCAQFYYGTNSTYGGNAKGFPGLLDAYDSTNNVVDAGGTTASTGSSVWLIKFGPKAVQWVWGNGGELTMPDPRIETIYDTNGLPLDGYVQSLLARPGLQVGSIRSAVRIKKLTADAGKGLTDSLLADALAKFEVGVRPDVIVGTRRSLNQLRKSRTVVLNATNGGRADGGSATVPQGDLFYDNIPIVPTDAIKDIESLTL
jgi:hypothetical protein